MTDDDIIRSVVEHGPPVIESVTNGPHYCIAATRVTIDVFRHFRIDAKPVSVRVALFNRVMLDHLDANDGDPGPRAAWPDGAWGMGAGFDRSRMPVDAIESGPANGWDGHLAAFLPAHDRIVDLSFGQFDRPKRDINVPPALLVPVPLEWIDGHITPMFTSTTDVTVAVTAKPRDRSYTTAGDWRRAGDATHRSIVGTIIREVRGTIGS